MNRFCAVFAIAIVFGSTSSAQTPQFEVGRGRPQTQESSLVGQKLWLIPNPRSAGRLGFADSTAVRPYTDDSHWRFPSADVAFTVISEISPTKESHYEKWYQVEFEDGSRAFVRKTEIDGRLSDVSSALMTRSNLFQTKAALPATQTAYSRELIFKEDPSELRASMKSIEAVETARQVSAAEVAQKAEAARKARGGVNEGMSRAQVIASSWGKPESVNKTIRSNGSVHEQWVYGDRNYLYFDNGVLTTIQVGE